MSWFIFAVVTMLGWGFADLFYKKSSENSDRYSHLKISVWVGIVMMVTSAVLLFFSKTGYSPDKWLVNLLKYSPASLGYIASMIIGYAGLRYLEVSIISPVQNASGAFSAIAIIVYFIIIGKSGEILNEISVLDIFGTVIIVLGVVLLAVAENKETAKELLSDGKKSRMGALALIFPLLYCFFDTLGTAADGIILDENSGIGLSQIEVLILYGFTFFAAGVVSYIVLAFKERKFYNPFSPAEIKTKGAAALCEEFGQVFYVYAMAKNPVLAAPMIASYCIVSVILSKIILKEKLAPIKNKCVCLVILGIVFLGISEGLSAR